MVIDKLSLRNFRNYEQIEVVFSPRLNIIYGDNGQGKTNLVESLYYLCNLDSFRSAKTSHILKDQCEDARICASLIRKNVIYNIQIILSRKGKRVLVNQNVSRKVSEHVLFFLSLAFTPLDVNLFRSSPQERRKFFDRTLAFFFPSYLSKIQELNKIVSQKNILLKSKQSSQLFLWNKLLAKVSQKIMKIRLDFINLVNEVLTECFSNLTERSEILRLEYFPSFDMGGIEDISKLETALQSVQSRELNYGYGIIGPHRDDYRLFLGDHADREFFSQGELRITNLSLKLAINQLLFREKGFSPVLIFDDLFSELDSNVVKKVLEFCSCINNQIFITSTFIPADFDYEGQFFKIKSGILS